MYLIALMHFLEGNHSKIWTLSFKNGAGERNNHANHLSHMCCREGTISALSSWPQSYFEGGLLFKPCRSLIFTGTGEAGGCVGKGKAALPRLEVPALRLGRERRHGHHAGSRPRSHPARPTSSPGPRSWSNSIFFNQYTKKKLKVNRLAKSKLNPQHLQIFSPELHSPP